MRTRYKQICRNCGHDSTHHKPGVCLHDIAYHPVGMGLTMFGGPPIKDDNRVACECNRWDGITVIDSEETYDE